LDASQELDNDSMKRPDQQPAATPLGQDRLLRPAQIAPILGISLSTFERMLASGKFPPPEIRIGRATSWRASTVQNWIGTEVLRQSGKVA
jgi:predicted DNA-binding transcriptional regulator AlpA